MNNLFNNISPLDNRYSSKISTTRSNFSEAALVKTRYIIEIDWLIYICMNKPDLFKSISKTTINKLNKLKSLFNDNSVMRIKDIESVTNHDVKAVEYFIREQFEKDTVLKNYIHLIHFGLTSEDINSLSYAVMIKEGLSIYIDELNALKKDIKTKSKKWSSISFLARTHGQPASPSTLGKEMSVFS
ncbi:lyase family protein, partial [Gammaproteobacteria bacterium]|nr:lyase family protein [Gammaproteobacteria bacterium]